MTAKQVVFTGPHPAKPLDMEPSIADQIEMLLQVLAAMACGGVIGLERELARRPAGFRTHMLIAGACALMVSIGPAMITMHQESGFADIVQPDPYRILEAVVTGIAFLGAGTIIYHRSGQWVEGLTTAGSLLVVGTIGVVMALELWVLGASMTVITVILLRTFNVLEDWLEKRLGAKRNSSKEES